MPAKTPFWTCGSCGFRNAPHALRQGVGNHQCEQCGAPQSHPDAFDTPR